MRTSEFCFRPGKKAGKVKKHSTFEWAVLALTAAVLLMMGGWFVFGSTRPADTWRVEVERNDSPAISVPTGEEGALDSLLEGEVIDLNTAGQADLERLPGIGQTRARAILDHRQKHGLFGTVDELKQVEGIGPAILEQLRPYVTVGAQNREQN